MTWGRLVSLWLAFSFALIVNRGPIFFPDTTAYVRTADAVALAMGVGPTQWSDRLADLKVPTAKAAPAASGPTPLAGRSVYYGAILWLLGTWGAALVQGLAASVAVLLLHCRLGSALPFLALPVTLALSSASIFAALLTPDIFAALAIVAMAVILTSWRDLSRWEQIFWFSLLLIGVLTHSATLLILAALATAAFVFWRRRLTFRPALLVLALGIIGELSFSAGVTCATGHRPLRPPFLSARLIDDGPGLAYLRTQCPKFALCDFYAGLPQGSDAMLWSSEGQGFISMAPERQRAWSDEDLRFVITVFLDRPLDVSVAWIAAVGRQAVGYSLSDVTTAIDKGRMPPNVRAAYEKSLVARGSFPTTVWDVAGLALLLLSMAVLLRRDLPITVKIMLLGVLVNVIICGALSTPHDRYLMRVAWLLPLCAIIASQPLWIPGRKSDLAVARP